MYLGIYFFGFLLMALPGFSMGRSDGGSDTEYEDVDYLIANPKVPTFVGSSEGNGIEPLCRRDACSAELLRREIKPGVHTYLFDVCTKVAEEQVRLAGLDFKKGIRARTFLGDESWFHQAMADAIKTARGKFANAPYTVFFVDFDGVLAKRSLVRKSDGKKFHGLLDTTNTVLSPEWIASFHMLETEEYARMLDDMVKKLSPKDSDTITKTRAKMELVREAIDKFREAFIANSDDFEGFASEYTIVSPELVNFLHEQKKLDAQFFVLSGRRFDKEKAEFLRRAYGDIFCEADSKIETCNMIKAVGDFHPSLSYIFKPNKHEIISLAPSFAVEPDTLAVLIDDHAQIVPRYKKLVEDSWQFTYYDKEIRGVFFPYPVISSAFDVELFLRDIHDFIVNSDEKTILGLQKRLIAKEGT